MSLTQGLRRYLDMADAGVSADVIQSDPDYWVQVRAFRLREFYRCPRCDQKALNGTHDDWQHIGWLVRCDACQWSVFAFDQALIRGDDGLLDIIRHVPVLEAV